MVIDYNDVVGDVPDSDDDYAIEELLSEHGWEVFREKEKEVLIGCFFTETDAKIT